MKRLMIAILLPLLLLAACSTGSEVDKRGSVPRESELQASATMPSEPTAEPVATTPPVAETDTPVPATVTAEASVEEDTEAAATEPPTLTPLPMPTEDLTVQVVSGQTEEGVFFMGDLNAPLTVIDYSDFL